MTWKSTAIHDGNELKRFGKKHSGGGFGGAFTKNLHEPFLDEAMRPCFKLLFPQSV